MTTKPTAATPTSLIAIALCATFALAPLMYYHFVGLWAEEYYQYFPFVLAAVGWLLWERWHEHTPTNSSRGRDLIFWVSLVGGLLILTAATVIWSPWVASVAFVLLAAAAATEIHRIHGRITNLFGIWCLLWLLVPIPLQFDHRFVVFLQRISAVFTSQLLDLLRIDHLMVGTILDLPGKRFGVEEACSGIVSVMSVIAAGAIYVVWKNRTLPHSLMLLAIGVGWAVAMNVARITTIAVAYTWWDIDLSTGWEHDTLGLVLFSLTFIAVVSSDSLLCFLNEPIHVKAADRDVKRNPIVRWWNFLATFAAPQPQLAIAGAGGAAVAEGGVELRAANAETAEVTSSTPAIDTPAATLSKPLMAVVCGLCVVLGGLQLFVLSRGYQDPESPVQLALSLDTTLLPDKVGDWEKVEFQSVERETGNEFGNFSKQFTYRHVPSEMQATVSLDFPYRGGWHELSVCYRNFGWPLLDRTVEETPIKSGGKQGQIWPVIRASYEKPDGQHGFLAFSGTNGTGDCLEPPSTLVLWRPWFRLRRRLLHRMSPRFFQFQAWLPHAGPISDESKTAITDLFLELRPHVIDRLTESPDA